MARRSPAANRYADAIFEVAQDDGSHDLWLRQLGDAAELLTDRQAAQVLLNPVIPNDRKEGILAAALPGTSSPVTRLLNLLVQRRALEYLPQILERLRSLVDEARGVETAHVTTAVPLGPAERELLRARLSAHTGKQVQLEESVDASLIGGVVAQIGDQIIDGSVRGRLERLRRTLVGA